MPAPIVIGNVTLAYFQSAFAKVVLPPQPPGDEGYRPLRAIILVTWKDPMSASVLKSMAELQNVINSGAVNIKDAGVVVNMPFLTWPGGKR